MSSTQVSQSVKDFYNHYSQDFSATRNYSWPGWEILWDKISPDLLVTAREQKNLKVLDLGCGNARLAEFYTEKILQASSETSPEISIHYTGADISEKLLQHAGERLKSLKAKHTNFNYDLHIVDLTQQYNLDVLESNLKYDIVNLMAVMHHIALAEEASAILRYAKSRLSASGIIVFTTWDFLSDPKLSKLIQADLGNGNYSLSWGNDTSAESKTRFVHHYNTAETEKIISSAGLTIIDTYRADGRNAKLNHYYLCR